MAYTVVHRITECGEGDVTWEWARRKMAMIIRIAPKYIPKEWVVRPQFNLWPPKKHRAILWLVVHVAVFRIQRKRELTHNDFMDFLRRSRWKVYNHPKRSECWDDTWRSSTYEAGR
jgi:hypothetical protein